MKKIFTLFVLAAMTLSMSAQTVYTDAATGLNFVITGENTAKIVAGNYRAMFNLRFSTVKQDTMTYKVTEIGDRAFKNCTQLKAFLFDDDYTSVTVGEEAFAGCTGLQWMKIANCSIIRKRAFVNCASFEGDGLWKVTSIGDSAFVGCTNIDLYWIVTRNSSTLTFIGANAFEGCNLGNKSKILGFCSNQVSQLHIGENAFKGCTNVTEIGLGGNTKITYDGDKSPFDGIKEQVQSVTLSNSITSIPAKLFAGMGNASIAITATEGGTGVVLNNLQTIGDSAFAGCAKLDSAAINRIFGSKLTTIGADAFNGCSAVTALTLPASLTTIGDRAFAGMSSLAQITANMTTPPAINANVFDNCGTLSSIKLKVSDANYNTYKAANVWKDFNVQRRLWTINFSGHDINKATIQVLNAANDEVLDESQIPDGTNVKFVVTPNAGYVNKQNPEPMVITGDEYIVVDMYAITYRKRFIAQDGHGYFTFKKNGVDYDPELDNMNYGIYEYGSVLSVTAHAIEGYKFLHWSNSSTNPTCSISFTTAIPSPDSDYFDATDFTYRVIEEDTNAIFEEEPAAGIDNTSVNGQSVKRVVNGQLLIFKNGKTYNVLGAEVK
ncbi:MAG: leucine-rich repeat domain-containing protein [Paludibacteraceae bacterium]|nr:leucine-rich repeat domain-containing protein [Paludibacteraceae bacterium]